MTRRLRSRPAIATRAAPDAVTVDSVSTYHVAGKRTLVVVAGRVDLMPGSVLTWRNYKTVGIGRWTIDDYTHGDAWLAVRRASREPAAVRFE